MQRALVGHEELVGGDALVRQRRELLERAALVEVGDRDVVAACRSPACRSPSRASSSSASANVWPCAWMQKSTWQVVPPNAAAVWPDSKSSIVTVPPKGMSRCVCGSTQPGSTYLPVASIVWSAGRRRATSPISVDALALDEDVGDVVVGRGDDAAALDQDGHRAPAEFKLVRAMTALSPATRTVAELRELQELTGDENGAQRVAWTETWATRGRGCARRLDGLPLEDESTRPGTSGSRCRASPSARC